MNMREKPFKQALQRDIAAAATDLKELRRLARALIEAACPPPRKLAIASTAVGTKSSINHREKPFRQALWMEIKALDAPCVR